ncbi:MAG: hypothetical protein ACI30A_06740 [Paludibacteraceae bacterium]
MKQIKIKDLVKGERYRFEGDLQNGDFITHENVVRKVSYITNTHVHLECGRRFIINENLTITEFV